jgi:hypothetical protein
LGESGEGVLGEVPGVLALDGGKTMSLLGLRAPIVAWREEWEETDRMGMKRRPGRRWKPGR